MIKFGTTRIVFLIGNWAIKIPNFRYWCLFLQGLLANIEENRFSRANLWPICPVTFCAWGGWFIIMKRAWPLTIEDLETLGTTLEKICEYYPKGFVEAKLNSFGWVDNRLVCIDYGN